MGKGSNVTTSTTSANPTAAAAYTSLLGQAANTAATPYQAYTGQLVAPVNSQQTTGINNINANAGFASPFISQAAGLATGAANPLTQSQIQNYQNPFTQDVVNATQAQFNNQNQQQQAALTGNQISQGALGGNRTGVAASELANQQQLAQAPVIAGLENQGYTQALQTAQQQYQANPLAAAGSIANFGIGGQNAALQGAQSQVGAGTLQQQTQQALDTANYGQFQNQQAYPFQTEQWLAGLEGSIGPNLGGTNQTVAPAPNMLNTILGGTAAGVGALGSTGAFGSAGWLAALSDRRAKENIHPVGNTFDGQTIYKFNYKGDPSTHVGLMAQEVEKKHPESVHNIGGVKFVDYDSATKDAQRALGGLVLHRDSGGGTGGGVSGFPYSAASMPWSTAKGYVPSVSFGGGHGLHVQGATNPNQSSQSQNTQTEIQGLGAAFKGWNNNNSPTMGSPGVTSPLPIVGAAGDYAVPTFVASGGKVSGFARCFADGGSADDASFDERFTGEKSHSTGDIVKAQLQDLWNTGKYAVGALDRDNYRPMGNLQDVLSRYRGGPVAGFARGYADGGMPTDFASLTMGDPAWANPDVGPGYAMPAPQTPFEGRWAQMPPARVDSDFLSSYEKATGEADPRIEGAIASAQPKIPLPMSRPADAPVMAADDSDDETPVTAKAGVGTPATLTRPVVPPETPLARDDAQAGFGTPAPESGVNKNFWPAVMATGLGMMASKSPFWGVALGEGGLQGLNAFSQAQAADLKAQQDARRIDMEAQRLQMAAQQAAREMAAAPITADGKINPTYLELKKREAEINEKEKFTPIGAVDVNGSSHPLVMGQSTGKVIDAVTGKPPADDAKFTGKNAKPEVSDEDAKAVAMRYVKTGDRTQLQGLGVSGAARQKVNHYITEVKNELGVSDEELGQRVAEFEGRKAGQRTLGTQEAKMGSAAFEAEGAIKQARGVIERLPRYSFLPLNKLIQGFSNNTLNPDQAELYGRTQAIVNTYAAVMARGANVTTDSARGHAEALLNTAGNPETYNRMLDTMLQEINMAKGSPERMREFYRQQYGPKAVAPAGSTTQAPAFTPPAGAVSRVDKTGKTWWYDPATKQPYPGQQ